MDTRWPLCGLGRNWSNKSKYNHISQYDDHYYFQFCLTGQFLSKSLQMASVTKMASLQLPSTTPGKLMIAHDDQIWGYQQHDPSQHCYKQLGSRLSSRRPVSLRSIGEWWIITWRKQHHSSNTRSHNNAQKMYIYISLCFNRHFPGELGLVSFTGSKDDASGGDNWSYKISKAPVKLPSTNQHPVFIGRMPFLLPNQQCLCILQVNADGILWFENSVDPCDLPMTFQPENGSVCYMNENISPNLKFLCASVLNLLARRWWKG